MNWHYAVGNQQTGPVSEAQLDDLVRSGKINQDTLVWHEGMAGWQPLRVARTRGRPPSSGAPSGIICAECGKAFPPTEVIKVNQSWVCAQCKPIFLQRLREGAAPAGGGMWRSGQKLVARSETTLPDRCVKCNAPTDGYRQKRVLYWMHPLWLLLILLNLIILVIVYLIIRKKAVLHIGLCEKHRARRKRGLIVGWGSFMSGIVLIFFGAVLESGWTALTGVLLLLIGGIYGAIIARLITPTKIEKETVWVTGCHRDFLAELPEWPGP